MKQQVQEKYMELQLIAQSQEQMKKQLELLGAQAGELEGVMLSVQEIADVEAGTEILVPVANGIFAKASLKDGKSLMVNVGGDAGVEKSWESVNDMLSRQLVDIAKLQQEMRVQLERLSRKRSGLEKEFAELNKNV